MHIAKSPDHHAHIAKAISAAESAAHELNRERLESLQSKHNALAEKHAALQAEMAQVKINHSNELATKEAHATAVENERDAAQEMHRRAVETHDAEMAAKTKILKKRTRLLGERALVENELLVSIAQTRSGRHVSRYFRLL